MHLLDLERLIQYSNLLQPEPIEDLHCLSKTGPTPIFLFNKYILFRH